MYKLSWNRDKQDVMYEKVEAPSEAPSEAPLQPPLVPKIRARGYIMSYSKWLEHFGDEVTDIIQQYENFILETCHNHQLICSVNHNEFTERMSKLIYKTSMNRYKYYSAII